MTPRDEAPAGTSLLMQSAWRRLALACGLVATLWLAVAWAIDG